MADGVKVFAKQDPEKVKQAEETAKREISKLDLLLKSTGWGACSPMEKAILITYIKARELDLLPELKG